MKRDLRRSLVWPPTQSKAGYEARTGSLGLYPVGLEDSHRERLLPHGEKCFPYAQHKLLFQFTHFVSPVLPPFGAVKSTAHLRDDLLISMGGLLLDPLKPSPLAAGQTLVLPMYMGSHKRMFGGRVNAS